MCSARGLPGRDGHPGKVPPGMVLPGLAAPERPSRGPGTGGKTSPCLRQGEAEEGNKVKHKLLRKNTIFKI